MGIPFLEPPWITKSIGQAACCPPECYKSVRIGKVITFSLQETLEGHLMVGVHLPLPAEGPLDNLIMMD